MWLDWKKTRRGAGRWPQAGAPIRWSIPLSYRRPPQKQKNPRFGQPRAPPFKNCFPIDAKVTQGKTGLDYPAGVFTSPTETMFPPGTEWHQPIQGAGTVGIKQDGWTPSGASGGKWFLFFSVHCRPRFKKQPLHARAPTGPKQHPTVCLWRFLPLWR